MKDVNFVLLSGTIKPGTINHGSITKGDKEIIYLSFILQAKKSKKWTVYAQCKMFGERASFYHDKIRDNTYVMVQGGLEVRMFRGSFFANISVDNMHILSGFEHEYWESGEEGTEIEIPMQVGNES